MIQLTSCLVKSSTKLSKVENLIKTKVFLVSLLLIALLIFPGAMNAWSAQRYMDRLSFYNAVQGETILDFESETLGPIIGDPWLANGIVFDAAGGGDNMALANGGGSDNNIYAMGGEDVDIDITMTSPVLAFGLGIFSNTAHTSSERIIFLSSTDEVLLDYEMPVTGVRESVFIGYVSDTSEISKIMFIEDNNDNDYVGIGDVAFASVIAPEPISSTLFIVGAATLGFRRFRKQRTAQTTKNHQIF